MHVGTLCPDIANLGDQLGKINFQTSKAILLHLNFQEFQAILNGNKRYCRQLMLPVTA